MPIYTHLASCPITTRTFWITKFTISKFPPVTPKSTVIVVSSKENTLSFSACKSHRCHLSTGVTRITRRTQTFAIQTHPISVAFLGTSFHRTSSGKRFWAYQIASIPTNCYILTRKHAQSKFIAHFNCQSFTRRTADSSIAPESIFSWPISLQNQSGIKTTRILSSCLPSCIHHQLIQTLSCKVGIRTDIVCIEFNKKTICQTLVFAKTQCSSIVVTFFDRFCFAVLIRCAVIRIKHTATLTITPVYKLPVCF